MIRGNAEALHPAKYLVIALASELADCPLVFPVLGYGSPQSAVSTLFGELVVKAGLTVKNESGRNGPLDAPQPAGQKRTRTFKRLNAAAPRALARCRVYSMRLPESANGQNDARDRASKNCARRESNPHAFRHRILSPARLPIPPLARINRRSGTILAAPALRCIWSRRLARVGCFWAGNSAVKSRGKIPAIRSSGL